MKAPAKKFGIEDEVVRVDVDARVGGSFAFSVLRRQGRVSSTSVSTSRSNAPVASSSSGPSTTPTATTRVTRPKSRNVSLFPGGGIDELGLLAKA
jgi:hypothetical protein